MLPRPSRIPVLTTCNISKTQHNKSKPTTQNVKQAFKASHIPISNHRKQKPANKPQVQQQTSSLPRPYDGNQQTNFSRPHEEITRKQPTPTHPDPTPVIKSPQKSPLLPTLPVQIKHTDIPRPSAFYNRKPTFSGPSPVNNHRFHQQHHISRPYTTRYNTYPTFSGPANHRYYPQPLLPRPSSQHQNFFTGPHQQHQQTQGHFFTRPYPQHQQAQEHFFTRPYQQPQGHCTQQVFHVHISLPYPPQYCAAWRQKTTGYKDILL